MVDAVAAGACSTALKANDLCNQAVIVEQLDLARIDQWEKVAIEIALWFRCRLIGYAMLAEAFDWPFAAVAVALSRLGQPRGLHNSWPRHGWVGIALCCLPCRALRMLGAPARTLATSSFTDPNLIKQLYTCASNQLRPFRPGREKSRTNDSWPSQDDARAGPIHSRTSTATSGSYA
jgi:hypothetical protein